MTAFVLFCSNGFLPKFVKGESSSVYLTGVRLVDEKGQDISGREINPKETVSILYSYSIPENIQMTPEEPKDEPPSVTPDESTTDSYEKSETNNENLLSFFKKSLQPSVVLAEENLKLTISIPDELNVIETGDFDIFDVNQILVGKGSMEAWKHPVNK